MLRRLFALTFWPASVLFPALALPFHRPFTKARVAPLVRSAPANAGGRRASSPSLGRKVPGGSSLGRKVPGGGTAAHSRAFEDCFSAAEAARAAAPLAGGRSSRLRAPWLRLRAPWLLLRGVWRLPEIRAPARASCSGRRMPYPGAPREAPAGLLPGEALGRGAWRAQAAASRPRGTARCLCLAFGCCAAGLGPSVPCFSLCSLCFPAVEDSPIYPLAQTRSLQPHQSTGKPISVTGLFCCRCHLSKISSMIFLALS